MWEKLTPDDIARVKHKLSLTRAATLSRHAVELKSLDAERSGIEELERLIATFAAKYSTSGASSLQPTTQSDEQPTETIALEEHAPPAATPEAQQDAASPGLRVHQQVSPNFGIPLRRAVGH
jgi:hypothetical protein